MTRSLWKTGLPRIAAAAVTLVAVAVSTAGAQFEAATSAPAEPEIERLTIRVSTVRELREALTELQAGTTVSIAPGVYDRGCYAADVHGTPKAPIIIEAEDPEDPPVIWQCNEGVKLSRCSWIELRAIVIRNSSDNGINIDDGGREDSPSHHILVEDVSVLETGPQGNHDSLKLSGVQDFVIRNCRLEAWGGAAIDMVGCHRGIVEGSTFKGDLDTRNKGGIQIKGGSSSILIQTSTFVNAGERVMSIGGATGTQFFRPSDARTEAEDITFAGNWVVGGQAHVTFVTSRYGHVHHNLFYAPDKWLIRILQETKESRFLPSQRGLFEKNIVVTKGPSRELISVGSGTSPSSFTFRHNAWYLGATQEKPRLPTPETDGAYGIDPQLEGVTSQIDVIDLELIDRGTPRLRIGSKNSVFEDKGPNAYVPWTADTRAATLDIPPISWIPPPERPSYQKLINYGLIAAVALILVIKFTPAGHKLTSRLQELRRKLWPGTGNDRG